MRARGGGGECGCPRRPKLGGGSGRRRRRRRPRMSELNVVLRTSVSSILIPSLACGTLTDPLITSSLPYRSFSDVCRFPFGGQVFSTSIPFGNRLKKVTLKLLRRLSNFFPLKKQTQTDRNTERQTNTTSTDASNQYLKYLCEKLKLCAHDSVLRMPSFLPDRV